MFCEILHDFGDDDNGEHEARKKITGLKLSWNCLKV